MITEEQKAVLATRRAQKKEETRVYVSQRFGIPVADVIDYNSGSAYSKVWVRTKESADKVSAAVKGGSCNGGMFHGMSLGGVTLYDGAYEVMV